MNASRPFAVLALLATTFYGVQPGRAQRTPLHEALTNDPSPNSAPMETVSLHSVHTGQTLHLKMGESLMLRSDSLIRRIYVGNPAVLQSFTASPKEFVITAKTAGISSLVVWDAAGKSTLYTVSADLDQSELQNSLSAAYPGSSLQVMGSGDRLMLSGDLGTQEQIDGATKLAGLYSKEVVNSIRMVPQHGKQVELKLRIVEVDRTKLEQLGFNIFLPGGTNVGSISTQQFASTATLTGVGTSTATITPSDPLNLFFYNFTHNVGITVKDLEQKDLLQILAEPTLTTMSGLPAHFLSGGEFPFPVAQGGTGSSTAIAIQFKTYGIKIDFTPTVNADNTINMKIIPEVSALDYSNAVSISGFTVPALSTRRAETAVELRSGQTFMLSGLLDHRTTEVLSRMPGIGSIPVLGQLFRSKNNSHSVIELVVLATVRVVDPLHDDLPVREPAMVVPNLQQHVFDQHLDDGMDQKKTPPPPPPAPIPSTAATPRP